MRLLPAACKTSAMGGRPRGTGRRISWWQVPVHVRSAVEALLGAPVLDAQTQEGGFSPGAAARLRLANGGAAFVKALSEELHPPSMNLLRMEAAAVPHLPAGLPVPRLLEVYDDGDWLALVYEDVEGHQPAVPWGSDELASVVGALSALGNALQPSPWSEAPSFAELNSALLGLWREEAAAPSPGLDVWLRQYLEQLAEQDIDMTELVRGDAMLHGDISSDNILLTTDGRAVIVDWAWTCNGAPWVDLVCFAMAVNAEGGADAEALVRNHPLTRAVAPSSINALLLAIGLNYWRGSRSPERAAWRGFADATLRWLRRRLAA